MSRSIVAVAIAGGLLLSQSAAGASIAADIPAPVEFTAPATITVEYGEYWNFEITPSQEFVWDIFDDHFAVVTSTGVPAGYEPELSMYSTSPGVFSGNLGPTYERAPLGVGVYTFKISGTQVWPPDTYSGETTVPAQLTVTKAQLGVDLRVLADPNHPEAAVVSAEFTGRFVDEYVSSEFDSAAISPAGEWKITLTDDQGEVVTERSFERAAGDDNLAVSFYWAEGEPGKQYTAKASFTPSGSSGANFAVTPSADFSYTADDSGRPTPSSTAPAEAAGALPEPSEFSLPLILLIVAGVLIVGLGTLVTVFGVRLRRPTAPTSEGVAS